jgi:hypothetical protein
MRPSLIALVACLAAGCPITNSTPDASSDTAPDAFLPQVVEGIPNDAQRCELTRSELTRVCEAQIVAEGRLTCVDGTTLPVGDLEACVRTGWDYCERNPSCVRPNGPAVLCARAIVHVCLEGTPEQVAERDRWCSVMPSATCTVDRSRAMR